MFILVIGGGAPLDDDSKKNPLRALVRSIETANKKDKEAEEVFLQQSEAMNLKLKAKIRETSLRLRQLDQEIYDEEIKQMQLLDLLPKVEFQDN
jgi:hypothetical protein